MSTRCWYAAVALVLAISFASAAKHKPGEDYVVSDLFCGTSQGDVIFRLHPKWAPNGISRLKELVEDFYFINQKFYRVVRDHVVQFGIASRSEHSMKWVQRGITDDDANRTLNIPFTEGSLSFSGNNHPNGRSAHLFVTVNPGHQKHMGRLPFERVIGRVVKGMDVLYKVVDNYYENGYKPDELQAMQYDYVTKGPKVFEKVAPKLDYIKNCKLDSFTHPVIKSSHCKLKGEKLTQKHYDFDVSAVDEDTIGKILGPVDFLDYEGKGDVRVKFDGLEEVVIITPDKLKFHHRMEHDLGSIASLGGEEEYGVGFIENNKCDACRAATYALADECKKRVKQGKVYTVKRGPNKGQKWLKDSEVMDVMDWLQHGYKEDRCPHSSCQHPFQGYGMVKHRGGNLLHGRGTFTNEYGFSGVTTTSPKWAKRMEDELGRLMDEFGEEEIAEVFNKGQSLTKEYCFTKGKCGSEHYRNSDKDDGTWIGGDMGDKWQGDREL